MRVIGSGYYAHRRVKIMKQPNIISCAYSLFLRQAFVPQISFVSPCFAGEHMPLISYSVSLVMCCLQIVKEQP